MKTHWQFPMVSPTLPATRKATNHLQRSFVPNLETYDAARERTMPQRKFERKAATTTELRMLILTAARICSSVMVDMVAKEGRERGDSVEVLEDKVELAGRKTRSGR